MVLGSVAGVSKNCLLRPCVNAGRSDKVQNISTVSLAFNPLVFTDNRIASSYGKQRRVIVSVASQGVPHVPAEAPELIIADGSPEECIREESPAAAAASVLDFASSMVSVVDAELAVGAEIATVSVTPEKKKRNRKGERTVYLLAATAGSLGFTTLAAGAVYYRFVWQMQGSPEVPYTEMMGTFALAIGAAVGMEYWARWAHKALWHASLWNMHESHHKPREGPFELNDVFAIINAVPAIALMAYGFFHKGLAPGLCFGAGLGITMFGMAYMFVHDGLVHRRFPVGPIADVPYLQKVAAAHQLHHADLFEGVPYGLFLGPQEVENVGGEEELQRVMNSRNKARAEGGPRK